ncbi:unnamed protein product [Microthlaspi erraticum]|uniref:Aspartic peptidase DDI1-type domain-containing protein n=1 Tax=Microthlaspi erraticum TaxID=1685480 RepID=A0A6D2KAZ7_9BRAS|nr:unnamed protein product [Microthlaspi erraticum]
MSEAFEQMKMIKMLWRCLHQINLPTSPTFLPKVKDQGKFTLPCTLGHIELDNALVDSGASINLISLTMAEKLGIAGALQRPLLQSCLEMQLPSLLLPRRSDYCGTIESIPLSSKTPEVAKVVKEKVDKEPRVVRDKVEKDKVEKDQRVDKGPRIEKPRLERPRVERP